MTGLRFEANEISVTPAELDQAQSKLDESERTAILEAIANADKTFHEKSIPNDWSTLNEHGAEVGEKHYRSRVGIYRPRGLGVPLVSTSDHDSTLAKVAQVDEIAVVTPPDSNGKVAFQLLAALGILGVTRSLPGGRGPSDCLLAFGARDHSNRRQDIQAGQRICKRSQRQSFGTVGIDLLPGPSEVMVIADSHGKPSFVAAALLAQAEHGSGKEEKIYFLFLRRNAFFAGH